MSYFRYHDVCLHSKMGFPLVGNELSMSQMMTLMEYFI